MTIAQHLSVDDVSILLACLEEVNITDAADRQRDLQCRLARALRRKAPDHYKALVDAGKIGDWASALRANKSEEIANEGSAVPKRDDVVFALQVEKTRAGLDQGMVPSMFRAIVWRVMATPPKPLKYGLRTIIDIVEADSAQVAASAVLEQVSALHITVTHAKHDDDIQQPDAISVTEAACAMAGIG